MKHIKKYKKKTVVEIPIHKYVVVKNEENRPELEGLYTANYDIIEVVEQIKNKITKIKQLYYFYHYAKKMKKYNDELIYKFYYDPDDTIIYRSDNLQDCIDKVLDIKKLEKDSKKYNL